MAYVTKEDLKNAREMDLLTYKQGIGVHCMNTMYPIPLVGEFPNPPENEKKESVAALQHRKTGTKRSAAEIYILRKKSNLYIFRKKESLIQ